MAITGQVRTMLQKAARLRAVGQTWAEVADVCKRKEKTCRNWPNEHPDEWELAYAEAEVLVVQEAEAKAWGKMVELMDGKAANDEPAPPPVQQSAAHSILANGNKRRMAGMTQRLKELERQVEALCDR